MYSNFIDKGKIKIEDSRFNSAYAVDLHQIIDKGKIKIEDSRSFVYGKMQFHYIS